MKREREHIEQETASIGDVSSTVRLTEMFVDLLFVDVTTQHSSSKRSKEVKRQAGSTQR
jgi:hypothetical protein